MSYRELNLIEIDLSAIRHNLKEIQDLNPEMGILAVVKSDAYGHGIIEVSKVLEEEKVWGLAVFTVEEAALLRERHIRSRIFLLSGFVPGDEEEILELYLITGCSDFWMLDSLERTASKRKKILDVHIKVDTGMGRMGFEWGDFKTCLQERRKKWPHLRFPGLYSHLSSADNPSDPLNIKQLNAFLNIIQEAKAMGWDPRYIHIGNSAGLIHFKESHFHLVRPGLSIYGAYPDASSRQLIKLRPVMSFRSKIIEIRTLPAGSPVGYGHNFYTKRPSRIAIVPVGYDDGYMRTLSNRAFVLILGRRFPVVGNVCMKALMVDITDMNDIKTGDDVVFLGAQGNDRIRIEELATWGNTISYELMCLLGTRNQRIFTRS